MRHVEHAQAITLNAAITLTAMSRRTLWRRVTHGSIATVGCAPASSKGRTMLALCDVVNAATLTLDADEIALVVRADEGDAQAQADAGAMFFNKAQHKSALFWLQKAVAQGNADAMQWLGTCYASGAGVERDDNLAVMWIAKAASLGHVVARAQMERVLPCSSRPR
jgi:hypothetical protein